MKKYWLRGGLIALALAGVASVVGYYITNDGGWFSGIGLIMPILPVAIVLEWFYQFSTDTLLVLSLLIAVLIYFGIGAAVGKLVEKWRR